MSQVGTDGERVKIISGEMFHFPKVEADSTVVFYF